MGFQGDTPESQAVHRGWQALGLGVLPSVGWEQAGNHGWGAKGAWKIRLWSIHFLQIHLEDTPSTNTLEKYTFDKYTWKINFRQIHFCQIYFKNILLQITNTDTDISCLLPDCGCEESWGGEEEGWQGGRLRLQKN